MIIIVTIALYFGVLMLFSRFTGRKADNYAFYRGSRRSPWYMVAFGMIGASMSGVTFVSVPGMVMTQDMTYIQTCLGFILGYFAVAFILLPVYYRYDVTTIYTCLQRQIGRRAYKTGAAFFILSKLTGAAVRFYVVCIVLQRFVLDAAGVPFWVTVVALASLIWLYTRRGGIRTLVWTDTFHTACMLAALVLIIYNVSGRLGMTLPEAVTAVANDSHSRIFVMDDFLDRANFWKQFISGAFIVIVMTGLDQSMMQKNLTCKTLREAQKDMCAYGFAFVPANLLFLSLGVLLMMLASREGVTLPLRSDELLPMFAATGQLGTAVVVLFTIGVVSTSFASADSSLTALTTCWCVDIIGKPDDERLRRLSHMGMTSAFAVLILAVDAFNSTSIIDAIYILCSYTYGPLLGLFAYALFISPRLKDGGRADDFSPYIAVLSPLLCLIVDKAATAFTGYKFGYELLLLNGLLSLLGLLLAARMHPRHRQQQFRH